VIFIVGARSLNEEDLCKNMQIFQVPEVGISIRSKLCKSMKRSEKVHREHQRKEKKEKNQRKKKRQLNLSHL
jgi:hypothetical protein